MADPLSVAGLVTGVISLGLQVAGGLTNYLDAVKGRSEDLMSAKQGGTEMRDLLLTIQDLLPQVESNWPASATTVKRHVKSCHAELSALHTLLSELSQPVASRPGLRHKFENTKKKLSYPFERSQISHLEDRLAKVNSTLQMALQLTELNVAITSANQIREVHSLVVSLSQSQTSLQTHDIGASVPLTTAREIPGATNKGPPVSFDHSTSVAQRRGVLKATIWGSWTPCCFTKHTMTILRTRNSDTPIEIAMSLASKPSLLSSSIKTLEEFNVIQSPSQQLAQACLCRPSRRVAHHRRSWGHLSLMHQVSCTRRHVPGCPLSQIDNETQASKFTIEYFGLRKLFQTAFALSLLSIRGAGGRSISPGFTYYPTVDRFTAPAFRVISIAKQFMMDRKHGNETAIRTVQCCYDAIFELYRRKKASPKDITSDGASLMHGMQEMIRASPHIIADANFQMVTNLLACGVPVTTYDEKGLIPAFAFLNHGYDEIGSVIALATRLLPKLDTPIVQKRQVYRRDPGVPLTQELQVYTCDINFLEGCLEASELAEASGCGPLSLAARAGDEKLVQELIRRYPQSLEEMNDFGHTPLLLAIKHPPCLRLILEAGESSLLEKPNTSLWSHTPLACACRLGYKESAQILLAAGGHINHNWMLWIGGSCLDDVLVALKQRRDELKLLALEHLTQADAEYFGLHETKILDGCVLEVRTLLLEKGIPVPPHLCGGFYPSVYFYPSSFLSDHCIIPFHDKLWALGFRDIDNFDQYGEVPLTRDRRYTEKARWLIEHGADYWTPFSERASRNDISNITATPAHFLLSSIGRKYNIYGDCGDDYDEKVNTWKWLVGKLMQIQVSDTCFCACFRGGCTPLKAFFDCHRDYEYPINIKKLAQWCAGLTRTFQASFSEKDLIIILRRMTFDGVGLTHTCCNFHSFSMKEYHKSLYSSEEVDEIISEQSSLLTLFNEVLVELDEVAHEEQDGVPLIVQDPEKFWIRRWLPLIEKVLNGLDGDDLTAEERSTAEAVGVQWDMQPAHDEEDEDEDYLTPEYVMKKLKDILDE
ncbi:hypothetical protein RRF57_011360 [Xylaria bambusicola]|uniref:Fungal N-terminal domain-containing protein n=1 Tax=Xylaria bambusicola TaxID=326684 RepID=A0AAN7ZE28_9PEZI